MAGFSNNALHNENLRDHAVRARCVRASLAVDPLPARAQPWWRRGCRREARGGRHSSGWPCDLCTLRTGAAAKLLLLIVLVVAHNDHGHALPVERGQHRRGVPDRAAAEARLDEGRRREISLSRGARCLRKGGPLVCAARTAGPSSKANVPSRRILSRTRRKTFHSSRIETWPSSSRRRFRASSRSSNHRTLRRRWHLPSSAARVDDVKIASSTRAAGPRRIQRLGPAARSACSTPASFRPLRMTAIFPTRSKQGRRRGERRDGREAVASSLGRQVRGSPRWA